MATGRQGPKDVTVTLADSPGGTARNIHGFMTAGIAAKLINRLTETRALGSNRDEHTPIGVLGIEAIPLTLIFDTTSTTGSRAVTRITDSDADPTSVGRAMVIDFGDSKTLTMTVHLGEYEEAVQMDNIQMINCVAQPTGTFTYAA